MQDQLLESWKEISAYLRRNIRTCQYWEKKHDLPVHRLEDSPKARVFAYKKELDLWLQEKLHRVEIADQKKVGSLFQKKKTIAILAPALIFFFLITILVLWVTQKKGPRKLPSIKPSIVIMPFSNNSGDTNLDHYRLGMPGMLITDLSQSRYVSVVREDRLFTILVEKGLFNARQFSSKHLRDVARDLGASHILQGSYIKIGDLLRIDIDIIKTSTMESVGTEKLETLETDLSSLIDELTKRTKSLLKLTDEAIGHDIDERVGKVITEKPGAYRLYIEGRNFHNLNKYEKSIDSMEKALAIDPGFALALRSISESYYNLRLLSKSREYAEKALNLRERITERDRYHFELLFYKISEMTWDKAIAAGMKLIQRYPDDIRGSDLADLYFMTEQWDKAIEQYRIYVQNQEISYFPYRGASSSYEAKGLYNRASEILKNYLHDISDHHSVHRLLAFVYLCQGNSDLALDEAEILEPWNSEIIGNIYQCTDKLEKAERQYLDLLDSRFNQDVISAHRSLGALYLLEGRYADAENQLLEGIVFTSRIEESAWLHAIHMDLAYLLLISGKLERAKEECRTALKSAVEEESNRRRIESLHLLGLVLVHQQNFLDADQIAEKLKILTEKGLNRKLIRLYFHLKGHIELAQGNFKDAIDDFRKAVARLPFEHYDWHYRLPLPNVFFYASLAAAYEKSGAIDQALEQYEKISHLTAGKLWYGDRYSKAQFRIAQIAEQKGQSAKAVEYYQKFIKIMENADELSPEVEEARGRIKALNSTQIRNSPQ